ncbi:MAG: PASTA domain-containing protein [Ignavibacteriae bacterium]|nr:PASTA domain-containing protein [Ignavibacteriota bacterium]
MASGISEILRSERAKKVFLVLALLLILFFICNDLLMPWYVNRGEIIVVPSVIGLTLEDAMRLLDSAGLEGRKGDVRMDREFPEGVVIIQNPPVGHKVKKGRRVYLTVSGGESIVIVPTLRGRTLRDAQFALEREGLKLGAIEYQFSDQFPPNTVIEQKVNAGATVKRNTYISIILSQGKSKEQITVPDLTGKTLSEAESILSSTGLSVGNITYVQSSDLLPNTVIEQYPRAHELVAYGQAVDLFVVQGGEKKKEIFEY